MAFMEDHKTQLASPSLCFREIFHFPSYHSGVTNTGLDAFLKLIKNAVRL